MTNKMRVSHESDVIQDVYVSGNSAAKQAESRVVESGQGNAGKESTGPGGRRYGPPGVAWPCLRRPSTCAYAGARMRIGGRGVARA